MDARALVARYNADTMNISSKMTGLTGPVKRQVLTSCNVLHQGSTQQLNDLSAHYTEALHSSRAGSMGEIIANVMLSAVRFAIDCKKLGLTPRYV